MKNVCEHNNNTRQTWYKCVNSDEYYKTTSYGILKGSTCSQDPHFYQVCGTKLSGKITNTHLLCQFYLCKELGDLEILSSALLLKAGGICKADCLNTDVNQIGCGREKVALPSGEQVDPITICNGVCEEWNCEDEAECNGLKYGMYCKREEKLNYVPPRFICDRNSYKACDDDEDEANCSLIANSGMNYCRHVNGGHLVPLHNFTRCGVLPEPPADSIIYVSDYGHYCSFQDLAKQHTNCTDSSKIGLSCDVDGYASTVSKHYICFNDTIPACDDGIDQSCLSTKSCHVHKHLTCDNKNDCVDLADETHPDCRSRTKATCQRRFGVMGELPIPIPWLKDGVWDCQNGADETSDWSTCGEGKTLRFSSSYEIECENVFLCTTGNFAYIELHNLCDGLETCGNENAICSVSSRSESVTTSVLTANRGLTKRLSYCIQGLENMQVLKSVCMEKKVFFPDENIFGVDTKASLILPNVTTTCDNMYGEIYLYTSCTDKCIDAVCPLKTIPRYEVCPNQFPNRVGTLVNNEYLIFLIKSFGTIYTNDYFVCDDKIKCVHYSKVCDLIYDCYDKSDEALCTNHFKCNSGKLLPKTKKCDGNVDCADLSDECNEHCSKEILQGTVLKGISWLIGLIAVVANLVIIGKSLWTLKQCKTVAAVMNRCLIIMIAFGDLLIGSYLLIIAIYDTIVFRKRYCGDQIAWIISLECSVIGVISTIGSQISLFSMTGLSMVRLHGIWNSMRIPGEMTRAKSVKVAAAIALLILASATIAIVPIVKSFEDYFVNGVRFHDGLKIFIGTPNKATVLQVIEAYFGRTKGAVLKWKTLIQMIRAMFSLDLDYTDLTEKVAKVGFYGNDGVCLFKYFVQDDDPQRLFVWSILSLNFVCFTFISISYLLIGILSSRSSQSLASSQNNQQISLRNRRMNQRIAIIIMTDFLCWVPFIVVCILHSLNTIDATAWYSIFSMVILPINSVINPLLYDDIVTSHIGAAVQQLSTRISNLFQSLRKRIASSPAESTGLDEFEAQVENGGENNERETGSNEKKMKNK